MKKPFVLIAAIVAVVALGACRGEGVSMTPSHIDLACVSR